MIKPNQWTKIATGPCQLLIMQGVEPVYFFVGTSPPEDLSLASFVMPGNELNWFPVMTPADVWARGPEQQIQTLPPT